jgi:Transposase IS66 family
VELEINGLAPQERLRVRQERGGPLIVELEAWLREQRAKLSKNSDSNKPINYCLSRWNAAVCFLDEGALVSRTTLPKANYASMSAAGARLRSTDEIVRSPGLSRRSQKASPSFSCCYLECTQEDLEIYQ